MMMTMARLLLLLGRRCLCGGGCGGCGGRGQEL